MLANNEDPGQTPHYMASDVGLHCLPMNLLGFPIKNGLMLWVERHFSYKLSWFVIKGDRQGI